MATDERAFFRMRPQGSVQRAKRRVAVVVADAVVLVIGVAVAAVASPVGPQDAARDDRVS